MKTGIRILIVLTFLSSCKPKTIEKTKVFNDPKYSSNDLKFFSIDTTMKVLDLNLNQERDSILADIGRLLKKEICDHTLHFGLNIVTVTTGLSNSVL